jgi:tRNA(Leu) C34 or U34 (ribose-2'-O)-methylase TrmL
MSERKVFVGLSDPQTPANVGAVMRAAGCYGASTVYYSGSRYDNAVKYSKTNTQIEGKSVPLVHTDDFQSVLEPDMKIVCVDLIEGAISLPEFEHPTKAIYVFGPESGTVQQSIIDIADAVVYVPTSGCMNLAASVNVLLYDRLAKDTTRREGDEVIRASRQQGNNRKVKSRSSQRQEAGTSSVFTKATTAPVGDENDGSRNTPAIKRQKV